MKQQKKKTTNQSDHQDQDQNQAQGRITRSSLKRKVANKAIEASTKSSKPSPSTTTRSKRQPKTSGSTHAPLNRRKSQTKPLAQVVTSTSEGVKKKSRKESTKNIPDTNQCTHITHPPSSSPPPSPIPQRRQKQDSMTRIESVFSPVSTGSPIPIRPASLAASPTPNSQRSSSSRSPSGSPIPIKSSNIKPIHSLHDVLHSSPHRSSSGSPIPFKSSNIQPIHPHHDCTHSTRSSSGSPITTKSSNIKPIHPLHDVLHSSSNCSSTSASPIATKSSNIEPVRFLDNDTHSTRFSSSTPIATKSSNVKPVHFLDNVTTSNSSKKKKHSPLSSRTSDQLPSSSSSHNQNDFTNPVNSGFILSPPNRTFKDENPNQIVPAKPRPLRPQRPIKKQNLPKSDDHVTTGPGTPGLPLDEDDFFNLSSHNPINFISKALGLTQNSIATKDSNASKSATASGSVEQNLLDKILLDLDDHSEDEETDDDDDDDDGFDGIASRKLKRVSRSLPNWTKMARIVKHESPSEEDKNASALEELEKPHIDRKPNKRQLKGKFPAGSSKQRHRPAPSPKSRSPTPPPLQDQSMLQNAMEKLYQVVSHKNPASILHKQALEALRRNEEIELLKVLKDVDVSTTLTNAHASNNLNDQRQGDEAKGIDRFITFHASMVLGPSISSTMSKVVRDLCEEPIVFRMKSNQKFESVYQDFHQRSGIPVHQLIVSYGNIKLSPFVTPESVSIFSHASLKVYDSASWADMAYSRRQRIHSSVKLEEPNEGSRNPKLEDKTKTNQPTNDSSKLSESEEGVTLKSGHLPIDPLLVRIDQENSLTSPGINQLGLINITVRHKDKMSVDLLVRPSTKIKSIVKNFLSEIRDYNLSLVGFDDDAQMVKKVKIQFDGQDLNFSSNVKDNEICDQDVLDCIFI